MIQRPIQLRTFSRESQALAQVTAFRIHTLFFRRVKYDLSTKLLCDSRSRIRMVLPFQYQKGWIRRKAPKALCISYVSRTLIKTHSLLLHRPLNLPHLEIGHQIEPDLRSQMKSQRKKTRLLSRHWQVLKPKCPKKWLRSKSNSSIPWSEIHQGILSECHQGSQWLVVWATLVSTSLWCKCKGLILLQIVSKTISSNWDKVWTMVIR